MKCWMWLSAIVALDTKLEKIKIYGRKFILLISECFCAGICVYQGNKYYIILPLKE